MNQRWYCRINGQVKGPLEFPGLQALVAAGELGGGDEVRTTRSQEWSRAADIDGLFPETAHADDLAAMLSSDDRPTPPPLSRDTGCYARIGGQLRGPMTFEQIGSLAASGMLLPNDDVRLGSNADWIKADTIVGLFDDRPSAVTASRSSARAALSATLPSLDEFQLESPSAGPVASIPLRPVPATASPSASASSTAYGEAVDGRTWYCEMSGHEIGPLAFDAICELAQTGRLTRSDKVRNGLRASWETADSIVGLFPDLTSVVARAPTPIERRTPRPQTSATRDRATQTSASRPATQKRRKAPSSAEVDAMAVQLLAENDEQRQTTSRRASAPPTPAPPTRPPVRAAELTPPPPRPIAPSPTPAARTANRPPPPRARKSEPMFSNLNISGKHIAAVLALLIVGAVGYFGLPSLGFGGGGPTSDLQQIWIDLIVLRDRDNLKVEDWNKFKDQTLPKVQELAKQFEAEGAGDEEAQKALRVCREYLPAILKAGPAKLPPEWTKTEQTMAEFAS